MCTLLHKKTPNRKQVLAKEKYAYTKDDAKKCVRQTQSPNIKLKATDLCTDWEKSLIILRWIKSKTFAAFALDPASSIEN